MESANPYRAPGVETAGVVDMAAPPGPSFAVRTSLWLAAVAFLTFVMLVGTMMLLDPDDDSPLAVLSGVLIFAGVVSSLVGGFVLLAAPRDQRSRRRLAFVLNVIPLLLFGLVILVGILAPG